MGIDIEKIRRENKAFQDAKPIIYKIAHQVHNQVHCSWSMIESMAFEGYVKSLVGYDPTKSNMTFAQYASYRIKQHILNSLEEELRVVKMSYHTRKTNPDAKCVSISLDWKDSDDNNESASKAHLAKTEATFADGDVYEYIYTSLESRFSEKDCDMFYKTYGLKGNDIWKGKDIAVLYNVSECRVCQRVKKIIRWMQSDESMCEMLGNLL